VLWPGLAPVEGPARVRPAAPMPAGSRRPVFQVALGQTRNRRAARWTFQRVERWASPLLIVVAIMWLGLPSDLMALEGYAAPLLFGVSAALLVELCRRLDLVPVAVLVLLFVGAYSLGIGDAVVRGVGLFDIYASADSVRLALFSVILFLTVMALGSGLFDRIFTSLLARRFPAPKDDPLRKVVSLGLGVVVILSFVVSIIVGNWTSYGAAEGLGGDRTAGIRLEFLCEPAVLSALAIGMDEFVRIAERGPSRRRPTLLLVVIGLLGLIIFVRQIRRVMLAAVLISFFQLAWNSASAARWLGSVRRIVSVGVFFVGIVALLYLGSAAWRQSASQFTTNDLSVRLSDAAVRLGDVDDSTLDDSRARLNYLWLESASVEHQAALGRNFPLTELFISTLYYSLPGSIVPAKYDHPIITCETAFNDGLHFDSDLACTPSAEGFIAMGLPGVIIVALAWTPVLGLACFLLRRRTALGLIVAIHILDPLILVETGAFPVIASIRAALLGLAFVGVACLLGVMFMGWGALIPERGRRNAA
jgi:hypothetical protein